MEEKREKAWHEHISPRRRRSVQAEKKEEMAKQKTKEKKSHEYGETGSSTVGHCFNLCIVLDGTKFCMWLNIKYTHSLNIPGVKSSHLVSQASSSLLAVSFSIPLASLVGLGPLCVPTAVMFIYDHPSSLV